MIHIDETDPVGDVDPAFPYRDVKIKRGSDPKQSYDVIEEIGRGKFGTVYKVREKSNGFHLAAKFIPILKRGDRRNVEMEIEIMNSLQHPKIIQLYDAFEYNKEMCFVLELVEGGELFDRVLDENFVMTDRVCAIFVRQILEAMEYIHFKNIIHLDLKPENILCLTRAGNRIKIIDFGLAREYDPDKKLQVLFGTPEFVAPEIVNFESISYATDMWSVGVIAYVLVSGLSPFAGETDVETMANVTIGKYDFLDEAFDTVSQDAIDFITKLLEKEPSSRLTATEALKHKWVKRRPQYYPTKPPVNTNNDFQFHPVPLESETPSPDHQKENLKHSRERWNERTSPYVFDTNNKAIVPVSTAVVDGVLTSNSSNILSSKDQTVTNDCNEQSVACENCDKIEQPLSICNSVSNGEIDKQTLNEVPLEHNTNDTNEYAAEMTSKTNDKLSCDCETQLQKSTNVQVDQNRKAEIIRHNTGDTYNEQSNERIIEVVQTGQKFVKQKILLQRFPSIEDEWLDNSSDHMFVKGIPKPNSNNKKVVKQIVSKFNCSLDSTSVETKRHVFAETRTTTISSSSSLSSSKLLAKALEQNNYKNGVEEQHRMPWASERRTNFRISSLSRDVPFDKPNLHKEFNIDETIKLASEQSNIKGAKSLLHFLEKCIVKNQN